MSVQTDLLSYAAKDADGFVRVREVLVCEAAARIEQLEKGLTAIDIALCAGDAVLATAMLSGLVSTVPKKETD